MLSLLKTGAKKRKRNVLDEQPIQQQQKASKYKLERSKQATEISEGQNEMHNEMMEEAPFNKRFKPNSGAMLMKRQLGSRPPPVPQFSLMGQTSQHQTVLDQSVRSLNAKDSTVSMISANQPQTVSKVQTQM